MPQPRQVEELTRELLALYRRSWDRITAQEQALINSWVGWRRIERLTRLRELRASVEALMDQADRQALAFTQNDLPAAYLLGATAAGVTVSWTSEDTNAISMVAADTYTSLLDATQFVRDSMKDLIRTLAKEHVADKLIVGETAEQAARDLAAQLRGRDIAAVVYKNGARHGLADYADMVVRTKTAEAYSTATLVQLEQADITFVEVFDGTGCGWNGHDDPDKANGTVRPIAEARQFTISHPRCRRAFGGRPDVKSLREARSARATVSAAQQADQTAAELDRELGLAAAASRRALEAQVSRRASGLLSDESNRVRSVAHARARARHEILRARARRASARATAG